MGEINAIQTANDQKNIVTFQDFKESDDWSKNAIKDWIKLQSKLDSVSRSAENPFHKSKYAKLEHVLPVIKQHAFDCGFGFIQAPFSNIVHLIVGVRTKIWHISGAWLEVSLSMKPEDMKPQTVGKCITYIRRYSLVPIFGLEEEDDDANESSGLVSKNEKSNTLAKNKEIQSRNIKSDESNKNNESPIYTGKPEQITIVNEFLKKAGVDPEHWDYIHKQMIGKHRSHLVVLVKELRANEPAQPENP